MEGRAAACFKGRFLQLLPGSSFVPLWKQRTFVPLFLQVEAKNFPPALGHPGRLDVPDRAQRGRLSTQLLWTEHVLTVWVKHQQLYLGLV